MSRAALESSGEQGILNGAAGQPAAAPQRISALRLFLRAIGISFISILSVLIAFFAFTTLPQVQDVLLDARPYWVQEALFWSFFYLVGILAWALPLVFAARLLLLQHFALIGIDTEERFKFYIFVFPRFYAIFAFAAVLAGMISASGTLPMPMNGNAHEVILRQLLTFHLIALCLATAVIIVLILMRNVFISFYRRRMEAMERSRPGTLQKSLSYIKTGPKPAFLTEATWVAAQRAKLFMWMYLCWFSGILAIFVAIHFLSYSSTLGNLFTPNMSSYPKLDAGWHFIADSLSLNRAPLLLLLLGAWVPFITILVLLSKRHQFPFIVSFIAAGVFISLFIGDGHDARIIKLSEAQRAALKPATFAEALRDWKAASDWNAKGCERLPAGAPQLASCPRPILVAAEGGGSRAAFFLASFLGALEDESLDGRINPQGRPFHQQLFAISGVSGGAVGAAFFVSALKAQPSQSTERLKQALYRQKLWFRNLAAAGANASESEKGGMAPDFLTDVVSYKDSLQAALSNDFVSPILKAFFTRDVSLVSMFPRVMDRAGVLETSWEDAFDDVYGTSRQTSLLSAPFQMAGPSPDSWTPLLLLNATSINTGRRVIATPVKIADPMGTGRSMIFPDTYDFHELLCSPYPDPMTNAYPHISPIQWMAGIIPSLVSPAKECEDRKPVTVDIRLSTAASISARSPFVSPHANVRDRRAQITDSVVDGGYFDNSGVVTALDTARALKALDPRLSPFLVQVSSDPDWFEASNDCSMQSMFPATPPIPDTNNFRPLGSLSDPLTVMPSRISRGFGTILELPPYAAQINGGIRSSAQIHVCPQPQESFWDFIKSYTGNEMKPQDKMHDMMMSIEKQVLYKSVSLSWWLSPPLQAYLDGQLYSQNNSAERNCVLSLLRDDQDGSTLACPKR